MAVLNIRTVPDPILRRKANKIAKIDGSIRKLAEDMIETMYAARGIGLAANQVGVPLRLLVMGIPAPIEEVEGEELKDEDDEVRETRIDEYVLINPEFVKKSGERLLDEGCLSIPEYRGELTRAEWVKVKALDLDGKPVRLKAEGLMAQALEHEIDHLDGILYIDRLKEQGTLDTFSKIESPEPAEATAG